MSYMKEHAFDIAEKIAAAANCSPLLAMDELLFFGGLGMSEGCIMKFAKDGILHDLLVRYLMVNPDNEPTEETIPVSPEVMREFISRWNDHEELPGIVLIATELNTSGHPVTVVCDNRDGCCWVDEY